MQNEAKSDGVHRGARSWRAWAVGFVMVWATANLGAGSPVFQYRIPLKTARGESEAFVWIPHRANRVRGVVVGGMTLMERELVKDPRIRDVCRKEELSLLFFKSGLASVNLEAVLKTFAGLSGYAELESAPLFFVGHSAGGPQAKECATRMADRCFGLLLYRGGTPDGETPVPAGIPVLVMVGQFDEFGGTMRNAEGRETWEGARDAIARYRKANKNNLASLLVEPGAGHFAWSERNSACVSLFLRKAAQHQLPKRGGAVWKPSAEDGWLTDLAIEEPDQIRAAPYAKYRGAESGSSWHFDGEMACLSTRYHAAGLNKKDQFIAWSDPHWVDAGARFFFTEIDWVGDGQTFRVHPKYAETYPLQHRGQGPKWHLAGTSVGHSAAPIRVRAVSGPVQATGSNTLTMFYDALIPATEAARATFLAFSAGDDEYRYTEQVGMLPRGFGGITQGREQAITFTDLANVAKGSRPAELKATSDSGLPVSFYVAYGPAVVDGGKLVITEVPKRAKYPLEIKVVAYQFGRGLEPKVKTARPVEQVIQLTEK